MVKSIQISVKPLGSSDILVGWMTGWIDQEPQVSPYKVQTVLHGAKHLHRKKKRVYICVYAWEKLRYSL